MKVYVRMLPFFHRGVAQLVERVVRDHEAAGSSPVAPTIRPAVSWQATFIRICPDSAHAEEGSQRNSEVRF